MQLPEIPRWDVIGRLARSVPAERRRQYYKAARNVLFLLVLVVQTLDLPSEQLIETVGLVLGFVSAALSVPNTPVKPAGQPDVVGEDAT